MFITRKEFERRIKKAKKRGAKEVYEKCSEQNNLDSVRRSMYSSVDSINVELDKILIRLDNLESKRSKKRKQ